MFALNWQIRVSVRSVVFYLTVHVQLNRFEKKKDEDRGTPVNSPEGILLHPLEKKSSNEELKVIEQSFAGSRR